MAKKDENIDIEDNGFYEVCEEEVTESTPNYLELAQRIQADFENYKRRNKELEKVSYRNGVINTLLLWLFIL